MNLRQPFQISPTPSIGYQVPTPTTTTDVKSPLPPVNLNAQVWSCFYLIDIYKSKWFYEVKGQDLIPGWLNSWIPKKKNALLWCSIFSNQCWFHSDILVNGQLTDLIIWVGKYCVINRERISSVLEIKPFNTPPHRVISLSKLAW